MLEPPPAPPVPRPPPHPPAPPPPPPDAGDVVRHHHRHLVPEGRSFRYLPPMGASRARRECPRSPRLRLRSPPAPFAPGSAFEAHANAPPVPPFPSWPDIVVPDGLQLPLPPFPFGPVTPDPPLPPDDELLSPHDETPPGPLLPHSATLRSGR